MNIKEEVDAIWNMPKDNTFKIRVEMILRNALLEGVLMLAEKSPCSADMVNRTCNEIREL